MGWDNEEVIAILIGYIGEIHHEWGKYYESKHLQEYLDGLTANQQPVK
tara:strand:+ start:561 stop:704 length:144 start_codon:yes stop_codon:yes gene_type:complete